MDIGLDKNDMNKIHCGWDTVTRNIERMSDLVMDLLSYAKDRFPEYVDCFPNSIVEDACDLMSCLAAENNIEIVKVLDPSVGEVSMDSRSLGRVMMNLISNAIDACIFDEDTSKKWQVTVQTLLRKGNKISYITKDNGVGMNDDVKRQLFTSFFSSKGAKGTGLGLLVTRKLVEEHGGKIEVESASGVGTDFTVTIPYQKPKKTNSQKTRDGQAKNSTYNT